jgi:hypothetical protein
VIANITCGKGFKGLAAYLFKGRAGAERRDRAAWAEARNLPFADARVAPIMMRATAAQSRRVRKPAYHISLSWAEDERPGRDEMRASADRLLASLGLAEHQAMIVAHDDTRLSHMHIMVNRVHPEHGKAWQRSHDYRRVERTLRGLEQDYGRQRVPGRHSGREAKRQVARSAQLGSTRELTAWTTKQAAAHRVALADQFREAESWDDLSARLESRGLRLQAKGQGLIVTDGQRFGKLSQMGRDIRLTGLQERFSEGWEDYAARAGKDAQQAAEKVAGRDRRQAEPARTAEAIDQPAERPKSVERPRQAAASQERERPYQGGTLRLKKPSQEQAQAAAPAIEPEPEPKVPEPETPRQGREPEPRREPEARSQPSTERLKAPSRTLTEERGRTAAPVPTKAPEHQAEPEPSKTEAPAAEPPGEKRSRDGSRRRGWAAERAERAKAQREAGNDPDAPPQRSTNWSRGRGWANERKRGRGREPDDDD